MLPGVGVFKIGITESAFQMHREGKQKQYQDYYGIDIVFSQFWWLDTFWLFPGTEEFPAIYSEPEKSNEGKNPPVEGNPEKVKEDGQNGKKTKANAHPCDISLESMLRLPAEEGRQYAQAPGVHEKKNDGYDAHGSPCA